MPIPPKPIPPAVLAEGRRLYEYTRVPVDDIAALLGISSRTFYSRVRQWKWRRRIERVPQNEPEESRMAAHESQLAGGNGQGNGTAEPHDRSVPALYTPVYPAGDPLPRVGAQVIDAPSLTPTIDLEGSIAVHLMRAVERQLAAVEKIAGKLNPTPEHAEEAERAARALASLSRTLAELKTLRAVGAAAKKDDDDDAIPRNLDDLRRELSLRLERLVAGSAGEICREPEDPSGD